MVNLTVTQVLYLGIAASAIVAVLRLVYEFAKKQKLVVPDFVMVVLVYSASFGLAFFWFRQALPAFPALDPADIPGLIGALLQYVGNLLVALTAYSGAAAIIYDALLFKVKDALGKQFMPAVYPAKK